MRKIIVAVAPVALRPTEGIHNPLSPEAVAEDVAACAGAGASMVHLHVRDRAGRPTEDLAEYARTLGLIRARTDIVIQGSTGGMSSLTLEQRCVSLNEPRTEVASLNMGSVNFDDGVYINTLPDIRFWAARMREKHVRPELEIFEGGMVNNARILREEGLLPEPMVFGFALGFRGALPATAYNVEFLRGMLPSGAVWGVVHHHMTDMSLLATAVGMGASLVRVGYEDSIYRRPGCVAGTNAELVAQLVELLRAMGREPAPAAEARAAFGLPPLAG
ncbi:MAG: 3-keto-5-aminohexanoate cleavage protein [Kiritimatiellae bacterium]|nr:3-keto-5-aminohexanoate cleavage protein [Kiritimatiellia bacterium]